MVARQGSCQTDAHRAGDGRAAGSNAGPAEVGFVTGRVRWLLGGKLAGSSAAPAQVDVSLQTLLKLVGNRAKGLQPSHVSAFFWLCAKSHHVLCCAAAMQGTVVMQHAVPCVQTPDLRRVQPAHASAACQALKHHTLVCAVCQLCRALWHRSVISVACRLAGAWCSCIC